MSKNKHNIRTFLRNIVHAKYVSFAIKIGYFSRGIIYCLIGIFALGIVLGVDNESLNQKDIFLLIKNLPIGLELILILLFGLAGYSLWGFIRAFSDYLLLHQKHIKLSQRMGYIFSGIFYGSLVVLLGNILLDIPTANDSMTSYSSVLLHIRYGQFILAIIGTMSIISGVLQIRKAYEVQKPSDLNFRQDKIRLAHVFIAISRLGVAIRGLFWIFMGFFVIVAGLYNDPSRVKQMNDVFITLNLIPFGKVLSSIIAVGFIFFGISSLALSFWVSLPAHAKKY